MIRWSDLANKATSKFFGSGVVPLPAAPKPPPVYAPPDHTGQTRRRNEDGSYWQPPAQAPARRTTPLAPAPPGTPAPAPGVLTTPGNEENWFTDNKERLGKPYAGEGVMGEGADMLRGPNRMAGFADQQNAAGYFTDPSAREGLSTRQLPGLENQKSDREQLYASGNQGLNTWYDREYQKRQKRLGDQMAGMGVFGSGATARGMFELEAEMGSQQARDMADLAGESDAGRMERLGLADKFATGSDAGATDRIKLGADVNNLADSSVDRQGRSLADIGGGMADVELGRDTLISGVAGSSQRAFQDRERLGILDKQRLADSQAGLFTGGTDKISDEQATLAKDQIQALITEGTIDAQAADALQAMLGQGNGNILKILELIKSGKTPAEAGLYDADGTLPPGAADK